MPSRQWKRWPWKTEHSHLDLHPAIVSFGQIQLTLEELSTAASRHPAYELFSRHVHYGVNLDGDTRFIYSEKNWVNV